jgi:hypothetical protein
MAEPAAIIPGPYPAPQELTSHQPPALLVADVLSVAVGGVGGRARLLNPDGLDLLQLTEGAAQTLAVLMGQAQRNAGGGAASGMLVGVKDVRMTRPAVPGETVEVTASLSHELSPFRLYLVRATTASGEELLSAEVKTMAMESPT